MSIYLNKKTGELRVFWGKPINEIRDSLEIWEKVMDIRKSYRHRIIVLKDEKIQEYSYKTIYYREYDLFPFYRCKTIQDYNNKENQWEYFSGSQLTNIEKEKIVFNSIERPEETRKWMLEHYKRAIPWELRKPEKDYDKEDRKIKRYFEDRLGFTKKDWEELEMRKATELI